MSNVPKGIFYYVKDCPHVKNEVFYVSKSGESVFDRVLQGVAHEGLKKIIQFALYLFQIENPCLDMKTWMVCCSFYKWKIVHKSISVIILIGPWLK